MCFFFFLFYLKTWGVAGTAFGTSLHNTPCLDGRVARRGDGRSLGPLRHTTQAHLEGGADGDGGDDDGRLKRAARGKLGHCGGDRRLYAAIFFWFNAHALKWGNARAPRGWIDRNIAATLFSLLCVWMCMYATDHQHTRFFSSSCLFIFMKKNHTRTHTHL